VGNPLHYSENSLSNPDFKVYVEIIRRRKMLIILPLVGFTLAAASFAHRLPNVYRAETVILVDPQQVPDKYVPTTVTANVADRLTTLQEQVLSPTRLKTLVESQHLYPDPSGKRSEEQVIKSVQKAIALDVVNPGGPKMGAFKINYTAVDRALVAPMANLLAQMFIAYNQDARVEETEQTRDFIQSQLDDTKRQLDEKELQLGNIKAHNVLDLPESKPFHLEALANLRGEIQAIQDKISQDKREESILESVLASGTAPAPTIDVESDPGNSTGSPYEAEISKLESKVAELRTHYGPAYPEVKKTQNELDRLKARAAAELEHPATPVEEEKPTVQPGAIKHRNPVIEAQIEKLDEEISDQSKLIGPLQASLDQHTAKLEQMPVFEQQIASLQRDHDILQTQYTALLDKKLAAEMSTALEKHQKGERFVVLDRAQTPEKPYAPNRLLIVLAGLMAGCVAGVGLIAGAESSDDSIRTESQAVQLSGKPILSTIPRIETSKQRFARQLRALAMLGGTMVGSTALGIFLSFVSGRFF
jgi:polysaccharide biosynthesis transport protein